MRIIAAFSWGLLFLTVQEISAGGYALPYQSARSLGMGNAVTAGIRDPSAVYSNPAALTEIEDNEIITTISYVNVLSNVANSGKKSINRRDDNTIPTLFADYHPPGTDLTLGLGLYAPFGLGTSYKEDAFTRFGAVRSELRTLYLTTGAGWRLNRRLSIGAGLSFVRASALFSRALFLGPGGEGRIRITGTDQAYAYNMGVLFKPDETIRAGWVYRSRVDLNFDRANVKVVDGSGNFETAKSKGTHLPLPQVVSFGIHFQPTSGWTLEFVHDYTHWSDFRHLKARFSPAVLGGALPGLFIRQRWKNTSTLRIGSSYRIHPSWILRGGLVLDESPIPARTLGPAIPGADTLTLNFGLGRQWGRWSLDLGYAGIFFKTRRVTNEVLEAHTPSALTPGRDKYSAFDNFVSVSLGYKF